VGRLALRHAQVLSAHQIERRQRGVDMTISGGCCPCLTVPQPGALCAVTAEKRALETRGIEVKKFLTMQSRIRRASNNETRLGWVFPVPAYHKTPATLQRLGPYDGGIQVQMWLIFACPEVLDTAPIWAIDLPSICAPGPTALRVRTGGEQPAGGGAPQCGDRLPLEADDFIKILRLRVVAIPAMGGDARRQAMPMRAPWLLVEVDPRVFRLGLRGVLSRRRLRDGERQSAPACDRDHGERGHLQAACGTMRPAVEEVPETACLCATLRDAGGVMRGDQFRVWVKSRPQDTLMTGGPVKRLPKLPCDGAFRGVAGATQVAAVDATTQHKDGNEQRSQELPLGLTEPGQLFQDIVDHCHKPFTGASGSEIRSPH
jgi:hypothetical protein